MPHDLWMCNNDVWWYFVLFILFYFAWMMLLVPFFLLWEAQLSNLISFCLSFFLSYERSKWTTSGICFMNYIGLPCVTNVEKHMLGWGPWVGYIDKLVQYGWFAILIEREKNFGLRRRPTWIKCLFDPPPIRCPQDKGMEVQIYSSLSRVDTIVTSH